MAADPADSGSSPWLALQRLAGSVAAVPVTLGFLALGAGVLVGRSLDSRAIRPRSPARPDGPGGCGCGPAYPEGPAPNQ
jgi:hypothetical protein